MKSIFVGNLSFDCSEKDLRSLFENYGVVQQVRIMTDRDTSRSRGFAFVEMADDAEAAKAIAALNGHELGGRGLTVNEARPKEKQRLGGQSAAAGNRPPRRQPRW
jgi:cold-inducible RNA-binding protein